ncbi:MAG TPA: hypothetical protein VJK02_21195 [Anaerolineales bacterium]|nr:hypothetical protein [Anaerolineales bacterium]
MTPSAISDLVEVIAMLFAFWAGAVAMYSIHHNHTGYFWLSMVLLAFGIAVLALVP